MQNTTILNYKLTEKIGEGGFAEVWLAEHTKLGTKAAVKVLDKKIVEIEGFKDRFLRAAKLLSSLKHPYIVEIIDYDDTDRYVMIMEYLDGPMFREHISKNYQPTQPLEFVPLFLQVLDAVGFIHERGVVHRDIKPTNVIIQKTNNVLKAKLLDFDIAKDLNSEHTATLTNQQMGTITYMSPEQILSAKNIDTRSDIYSLGVMFFYVLTGKAAYSSQADSQFKLMEKIVKEPLPDLKSVNPNVPEWAIKVLLKSTEKDPSKRFQTCAAFADAIKNGLENLQNDNQIDDEKTLILPEAKKSIQEPVEQTVLFQNPPQKKSPVALIAIAAVVLIAVGAFLYFKFGSSNSAVANQEKQADSMVEVPQNKKGFDNSEVNALFEDAKKAQSNKNYSKAIELYEKAIQSGDTRSYNNLGVLYAFEQGKTTKGIKYFQKGVAVGDIEAMKNLGGVYLERKNFKEAENYFKKAFQIDTTKKTINIINQIRVKYPNFLKELQ